MKEYLIRMLYVEMLGHDASFGHIHAVKMAHSRALLEKRVGYLAVSLTLHKDHSFMLLLINTMQQDLKSDNYLEVSMALTAVAKLVNIETIPAILPLVVKLLEHKEGNVKKKAVMVLHRCHQLDPATISTLSAPIRKALCDSNISVMAASLNLFLDLCATRASAYKDLVPDFVSILKQVIEHRLPRDYDYHRSENGHKETWLCCRYRSHACAACACPPSVLSDRLPSLSLLFLSSFWSSSSSLPSPSFSPECPLRGCS